MRTSRTRLLSQDGGIVHKCWRAHNKEFLLQSDKVKRLYLRSTSYGLKHKSVQQTVQISAYCVMSNHSHQLVSYKGRSNNLSQFMRVAHSYFGQRFNFMHKRQGPVAYDRPKTPLVQYSDWHQMRVHFYIEANPLRAGMIKNLKLYRFSSYRFYAWGVRDEHSDLLTPPQWYLALGNSPSSRQSRYRGLFEFYLNELRKRSPLYTSSRFIGDLSWVATQVARFKRTLVETGMVCTEG